MTAHLTDRHLQFREQIREFAETEVAPVAAEIDREMKFPAELVTKMAQRDLLGIPYLEKYGGAGLDTRSYILAVEELSRVCSNTAVTLAAHTSLGTYPIYRYGSEKQKKAYLPKMMSGEWLGAFGLTEPNAGSDAGRVETTAVPEGDEWVINGEKKFMTNGGQAGIIVLAAVTEPSAGTRGISTFIVETDTPGCVLGKREVKMGWRGSDTRQVLFEDMRIPKANLLGRKNRGYLQFLETLDGGRISIAAMGLGVAEASFSACKKFVNEHRMNGQKLKRFQRVSFPLADMKTRIEAARHLIYDAARRKDAGESYKAEAAMAKLYATELATWAASKAVQVHGDFGYTADFPVERFFRDAKILEIGEGTSEIQRLVIAREVLRD